MSEVEGLECWTCVIPGDPIAKGRPRLARRGKKVIRYTPQKTQSWELGAAAILARAWGRRPPLYCAVEVTVVAVFNRPGRLACKHKRPCNCSPGRVVHLKRPDLDNCIKAQLDALQRAGVIHDDSMVCALHAVKCYASENENPRTEIRLCWGPAVEAMR